MQYAGLGCGGIYHRDWLNIDFVKTGPEVVVHDLLAGVPLPDKSCDVVYHAHFLGHLRRADADFLMHACYRVLKPEGVLQVVVPDLERMCRLYLEKLERALNGDPEAASDYEWMKLELYDQTVREHPSGTIGEYLRQEPLPSEDFVLRRIGS